MAPKVAVQENEAPLLDKMESGGVIAGKISLVSKDGKKTSLSMPDGSVSKKSLMKNAMALCVKFPPPPGGWYGPFGFFRMVTYFFAGMMAVAVLCLLDSLWNMDWWRIIGCIVLIAASFLSGYASYAHEGLANQVSQIKRQNDRFSKNNNQLEKQVGQLGGVNTRLEKTEKNLEGGLDKLNGVLNGLFKCNSVLQVTTMMKAMNEANKFGDMKIRIESDEFEDFWEGAHIILEKELPTMDMKVKTKVFKNTGVGFCSVSLIIASVLAGAQGEKGTRKANACLELAMFASDPDAKFDDDEDTDDRCELIHHLLHKGLSKHKTKDGKASKFSDTDKLMEHLKDIRSKAEKTASGERSIPDEHFKPLAQAVMSVEADKWFELSEDKTADDATMGMSTRDVMAPKA